MAGGGEGGREDFSWVSSSLCSLLLASACPFSSFPCSFWVLLVIFVSFLLLFVSFPFSFHFLLGGQLMSDWLVG